MITLRAQHMQAFEEVRLPEFMTYMIQHLHDFSPIHAKAMGDEALRRFIQHGITQANSYGFTHRGPVRFYIETMILIGWAFDADPQFPWATRISPIMTLL